MNTTQHTTQLRRHTGFSTIEVLVSTMLIGVVLVGALNAVGGSIKTWQATENDLDREALAHELMAVVLALPYTDPDDPNDANFGTESGESSMRGDFDDLDDFDGWRESPPEDPNGAEVVGMSGWTREVLVELLEDDDPTVVETSISENTGLKRITVTVSDPVGDSTVLQAIRSRDGSLEQTRGADSTVVSGLSVQISAGDMAPITQGVNLINHAQRP